jgi:hypothetical protein
MLDDTNKFIQNSDVNWRDQAKYFVQFIQRTSIDDLPKEANPLDIAIFKQGIKILHEEFCGLADVLDASQSSRTDEAYMHLRALMAAVFILGQSAVMSPKAKKLWLSEFQSEKGKRGAKINKQKAAAWLEPVIDLAKDMRSKNSILRLEDLATKILGKWDKIDFKGKTPPPVRHSYLVKILSKNLNGK